MKYAGSVSLSECLTLVTAVTFVIIMVLGFGLGLCISNSNTIFLFTLHFNSRRSVSLSLVSNVLLSIQFAKAIIIPNMELLTVFHLH